MKASLCVLKRCVITRKSRETDGRIPFVNLKFGVKNVCTKSVTSFVFNIQKPL